MRGITTGLIALALSGLMGSAAAQPAYAAGAAGRTNWSYECGPAGCARDATAWRVAAGYRFNGVLALEAFFFDLGRARSSDFSVDGTLGASGVGVQSLIGWHIGDFEFAAKLGLAEMSNDFRASPTSAYASTRVHRKELVAGWMGSYPLSPELSIRFDMDFLTVALDGDAIFYSRGSDLRSTTLGLSYRF
jgi:hypothetical protein